MFYADLTEEHMRLLEAPFIQHMFDANAADDSPSHENVALDPEEALEQLKAGAQPWPLIYKGRGTGHYPSCCSHWL